LKPILASWSAKFFTLMKHL